MLKRLIVEIDIPEDADPKWKNDPTGQTAFDESIYLLLCYGKLKYKKLMSEVEMTEETKQRMEAVIKAAESFKVIRVDQFPKTDIYEYPDTYIHPSPQ